MIDIDKYEGHTPTEHWDFSTWGITMPTGFEADAQLIADAPLLLEEVKRLRGLLNMIVDKALHEVNTQPNGDDSPYNTILNIAYEGVIE